MFPLLAAIVVVTLYRPRRNVLPHSDRNAPPPITILDLITSNFVLVLTVLPRVARNISRQPGEGRLARLDKPIR